MIQDIGPSKLYNEYRNEVCKGSDKVFSFTGEQFVAKRGDDNQIILPRAKEFPRADMVTDFIYLFAIDNEKFYLYREELPKGLAGFGFEKVRSLRDFAALKDCFAGATAYHLYVWYRDNKFCGRCGQHMHHSDTERALVCPTCGLIAFPKIAPAVIVGVINGDKILLTKYAGRAYKKYALIAGFTEIGETAEETVHREVMEEVGLKVKNVRYYKSQPWGTDSNLLMGFFADLDGDDAIKLDEDELAVGEWHDRASLPEVDDGISLTREMMGIFKKGTV